VKTRRANAFFCPINKVPKQKELLNKGFFVFGKISIAKAFALRAVREAIGIALKLQKLYF